MFHALDGPTLREVDQEGEVREAPFLGEVELKFLKEAMYGTADPRNE